MSLGYTSGGELRNAIVMPRSGEGWAFLARIPRRGTFHGTEEMAALVDAVGRRVAAAHPRSVIGVGNVSLKRGGRSKWHASHQVGRDVDMLLFATRRGAPVNPTDFIYYRPDGVAADGSGLVFDVPRNLTLVLALVEQDEHPVQWIFIAQYLKDMLLAEAASRGVPEESLRRLKQVLHQPSDSLPHADHFHIRLYCDVDDRLYGCLDVPPYRDWVDRGEARFQERVRDVSRLLSMDDPEWRIQGTEYLARLRAASAVSRLVDALTDPERAVRVASLEALKIIGDGGAVDGVLQVLKGSQDIQWSRALFSSLGRYRGTDAAAIARGYLDRPSTLLHPDVAGAGVGALAPLRVTAARLMGKKGNLRSVSHLLELLEDGDARVRETAEASLIGVTNHVVKPPVSSRKRRKRARGVAAWRELADRWEGRGWRQVIVEGFKRAKIRLPKELESPEAVEALLKVTGNKTTHLRHNASLLLSRLTGHLVSPTSRSAKRLRRHWNRWWETEGLQWRATKTPAPAPEQPEKTQGEDPAGRSAIPQQNAGSKNDDALDHRTEDPDPAPGSKRPNQP